MSVKPKEIGKHICSNCGKEFEFVVFRCVYRDHQDKLIFNGISLRDL